MILNTLPYRALGEYPVTHGDAMGYEFVALSGRKHQIADNHFIFYRYSLKLRSSFRGSPSLVHRIFIVTPSKR